MYNPQLYVAIAEDHIFLRKGMAEFISSLGYEITLLVDDENELIEAIKNTVHFPSICIIDVQHDRIQSYKLMIEKMKKEYPAIKILALVSLDKRLHILKLIQVGIHSIVSKSCTPDELKAALLQLSAKSHFFPDIISKIIRELLAEQYEDLTEKEVIFLSLCCSELTYKEIADKMNLSTRAVELVRMKLFSKFDAVSRTGLVLKGLKNGIISI